MENFEKLGLGKGILDVLREMRFEKPSDIQEKAIPFVLKGKDVIGQAATGSGKTLVFGSALIQNMKHEKGVKALVLTPTRELAEQVAKALRTFSKNYEWEIVEVYGGVSIGPQINRLEDADIVVGTPGRILDHLNRRTLDLQKIRFLVLDEADRMVDMGFLPDVEKIINSCQKRRQTLLFSATISPDISYVSKNYMDHPKQITVESYVDPSRLKQIFYDVQNHEKFSLFLHLIKKDKSDVSMVFCNTRGNVETLTSNLIKFGVGAIGIHGGMNQSKRNNVMEAFYKARAHVLICTDVAARGLDIKKVTHIYNYDVPKDNTDYIHRIGRTARAGKDGEAIILVCSKDYVSFRKVLDDDSLKIKQEKLPEFEKVKPNFSSRGEFDSSRRDSGRGGFGGSRGRDDRRGGFRSSGDRRRGNKRYGTYGTGGPKKRGGEGGGEWRRDNYGKKPSSWRGGSRGSSGGSYGSRGGRSGGGAYGKPRDSGRRDSRGGGQGGFSGSRERKDSRGGRSSSHGDRRPSGSYGSRGGRSGGDKRQGSGRRDGGRSRDDKKPRKSFGRRS
ncbi:MAG: DEAD/DEAH box helicase [Nanoarchaeota archaeon]|nr:DEAD/DEAH box helicase [Nanoarchaeota archaeon]